MPSRAAEVAASVFSSYARYAVAIGILYLLTPFTIARIGAEAFGLWALLGSLAGLAGLLDLGMGPGVVKWAAEGRGGRAGRRNGILSTVLTVYVVTAVAGCAAAWAVAAWMTERLGIPASQAGPSRTALTLLLVRSIGVGLPQSVFRGALFGQQRIHAVNAVHGAGALLHGGLVVAALTAGKGLVGLAWAGLLAALGEHAACLFLAFRMVPGLRLSLRLFRWSHLKEAASFGLCGAVAQASSLVLLRAGPLVVGRFLPLQAVAVYALAMKVAENAHLLVKQFANTLTPLAAELHGTGDRDRMKGLLLSGTKLATAPAVVFAVGALVLGRAALASWVGPSFADGAPVLWLLTVAMALSVPHVVASGVLAMAGRERLVAAAAAAGTALNLALSLTLIGPLGLPGVALATLLSGVAVEWGFALPRACAAFGIPWKTYARRALLPLVAPAAAQLALTAGVAAALGPTSFAGVGAAALPGVALFGALFWLKGFDAHDRGRLCLGLHSIRLRWLPLRAGADARPAR